MNSTQPVPSNRVYLVFLALILALLTASAFPAAIGRVASGEAAPRPALQTGPAVAHSTRLLLLDTDLAVTKTATLEPAIAGSSLGYNLTVRNQGALTATGVILTDTLPLSVTFSDASPDCSYLSLTHLVTCTLTSLSLDASALLTITVDVDPAARGELVNNAVVAHDSLDPDPLDNTAVVTTTIQADADLDLVKTDSPDPATAGEGLLYTLTLTNNGPSDLTGAVLTDTLPTGVSFVSASQGCTPVSGEVICTIDGLSAGAALPVTITVDIDPATTGDLTNTALVTGVEADPDNANNSTGPVITTVNTRADLQLRKTDNPDPVTAGELLTYTLTLTNTGPSDALGVVLTDTLQTPEVSFVSVLPTPACSHAAGVVTCSLGTLTPNEFEVVTIVVRVEPATTGTLANDAQASSSTPDPDGAGPTAAASTTVALSADIGLSIQDDPDPVVAGSDLFTYTLSLVNNGPSLARSISVADPLPADVSHISSTPTQGMCSHTSGTVLCSLGNLSPGGTATVTILGSVAPDAAGPLVNTASANATTPDPVSANNTDTETTQISAFADLAVAKSGAPDPVNAGGMLTYTLTITNSGPSGAGGTVLTDTLPGEATFLNALPPQGSCGETGGVVVCSLVTLNANTTIAVPIIVTIDPGAGGSTLINQAEVASGAIDTNTANNTDTLNTTVTASADLQIQKFDTPDALPPGEVLTYTVVVQNNGPSDAVDAVFTDTLPAEVSLLNIAPGAGSSCSGTTVIVCDFPSLSAGGTGTVEMAVLVDPGTPTGSITNQTEVTAVTPDPDLTNNTYSEPTIIANQIVDLTVTKTDNPDPARPDEVLTYTIDVANSGPSLATGVMLTDTLPAGVTFQQASASQGSCGQTSPVVCALGDISAGGQAQITIIVTVDTDTVGLITNSALASSVEPDANIDDNTTTEGTFVNPQADLALAKADGPDPAYVSPNTGLSYPLAYTLTVTNLGPSDALSVLVTDTLPVSVTFQSATPGPPTCTEQTGVVTCSLGDMPAGSSMEVTILTHLDGDDFVSSTTLINQSAVTALTEDPSPADNSASASTLVILDSEPPAVTWTLPVSEGIRLDVENELLRLKVLASDNIGVERVRFKRWDLALLQWVYLGTVTSPPYEIVFETSELFYEWNEVRAETFDWAGNSVEPRIWLYRRYTSHLPVIRR